MFVVGGRDVWVSWSGCGVGLMVKLMLVDVALFKQKMGNRILAAMTRLDRGLIGPIGWRVRQIDLSHPLLGNGFSYLTVLGLRKYMRISPYD